MIDFFIGKRKCRGFRLCTGGYGSLFRVKLPVNFSNLFFFGGNQESQLFSFRLVQSQISSARIISSAWCFRLFICPTQAN